ncbi:hypothetical protein LMG32289_03884 [Cupriavidus pampae]|uniref:Uncharacterized protein n=2 Tax=Cupriavidus pampae TaxID=659251 RepID=A0ABM8XCC5_9BURK|nr:hypothetical protein LMG32289_03884 [Cupriavidus pampae]
MQQMLQGLSGMLTQAIMDWGLEVVKHVAIINAAGLAGATALAAAPSKAEAIVAVTPFLVGLLLAVVVMGVIFLFSFFIGLWYQHRLSRFMFGVGRASSLRPSKWVFFAMAIQWLAVAAAIAAFTIGMVRLIGVVG